MGAIRAQALAGLPEVRPGDDLAALIAAAAGTQSLRDGMVVAIAHKVVSKSEGAVVALAGVTPGARAIELAREADKDPRAVQVILDESTELVRAERGVIVSRTRHGFVCANAGVDASNVPDDETVVVLPRDPDASARALRARLESSPGPARGSSSATASGAPGVTASSTSPSDWPGSRRSTTGAAGRTTGGWCWKRPGWRWRTRRRRRRTSPVRRTRGSPSC